MTPNTIFFDLDGTIANSAPGILASYRGTIRALGHVVKPEIDLTYVIGPPLPVVMPTVLAPYDDSRAELAVATYRQIYGETGVLDATPYAGIPELLRALHSAGKRLYVATAKRTDFACRMLDHFGLSSLFTAIYGSEPGGALDHKPELIAHMLTRENLDPADTVMIGDRRYDMEGAHANQVRAIGALWGYGTARELGQSGADRLLHAPADLLSALDDATTIRPAHPNDLSGMMELLKLFGSYTPDFTELAATPAWTNLLGSPTTTPIVADVAGTIAATCTLAVIPNLTHQGRPYAVIENVATLATHRRQGLGRRVLRYAFGTAWAAGCYKIMLSTGSRQESTLAFYDEAGFTRNAKTYFELRRA